MPRRVISDFSKGMITDSISEEGAVAYLQDMYLRKKGELISRGPVYANERNTIASPAAKYTVGFSGSQFHPNFGLSAVRGMHDTWDVSKDVRDADSYQLIGVGLSFMAGNDTPQEGLSLAWTAITEGTNKHQVVHDVAGTLVNLEACYQSLNTGYEQIYAGELGYVYKWGGSMMAPYSTGTVTIAAGNIVTGSGTSWLTTAEVGQYILIDGIGESTATAQQRAFRITAIFSNTELAVESALTTDATVRNYRIQSVAVMQSPVGIWNTDDEKPRSVGVAAYHQSKLCLAGVSDASSGFNSVYNFDSIRFSGTPLEFGTDTTYGYSHMDLWGPNAQITVMPGIGGFIRGLVSMGGNLIVIKSHGLFKIAGDLGAWDGRASAASVNLISSNIGASGFRAWKETPAGLVMANETGLYVYDGTNLTSLTNNRIDKLWESFAQYATEYTVNTFGSLVVVGSALYPDLPCVCWDFEQDYFFVGTNMSFQTTETLYGADDIWLGHVGLAGHVMNMPQYTVATVTEPRVTEIPTSDLSSILHWNTDAAGVDLDASGINMGPDPIIATHPFQLHPEPPGDGRVNNIGLTMYADRRTMIVLRPGDSGVDQVVYSEHQSDGTDFGVNASITRLESTRWGGFNWGGADWGSSLIAGSSSHGGFVELEIPLTSEVGDYSGGYKNVRVPVDSFPSSPFVSAVFKISSNFALDDTSYQVRVQAIYIDFEPSNHFGQI